MGLFVEALLISIIIQIFFFIFAFYFKTDKVTDLSYGLTFIIISIFYFLFRSYNFFPQLLLTLMITLWGLRLSVYLFIRIMKTKKDERFDGIRENFVKFSRFWALQAVSVWVIMLPSIYFLSLETDISRSVFIFLGFFIWLFGLFIETLADYQKFSFKNNPENKGKWIQTGIWKYSRHPNYFGEMTLWWGIFIFTLSFTSSYTLFTIVGPLYITFLLIFVSGIPPLEKKYKERYKDNIAYRKYLKQTSVLFPLPLKKTAK